MAKYKLIKEYPCSPKLGTIAIKEACTYNIGEGGLNFVKEAVENNPEFWEKVIEEDYVILSFGYRNDSKGCSFGYDRVLSKENGLYYHKASGFSLENMFRQLKDSESSSFGYFIKSIQRLSDGEIFTIGDKVSRYAEHVKGVFSTRNYILEKIYFIKENELRFYVGNGLNLGVKSIKKTKPPLLTTEDGVDIFEGGITFAITELDVNNITEGSQITIPTNPNCKIFSTREAAEKYIENNKIKFSISDIKKILDESNGGVIDKLYKLIQ